MIDERAMPELIERKAVEDVLINVHRFDIDLARQQAWALT